MKNDKGIAPLLTVAGDEDLESSLAFVLATPGLLDPYSLSPLVIICL